MSLSDLIALDLKGRGPAPEAPPRPPVETARPPGREAAPDLRSLVGRALDVVREFVAADDDDRDAALLTELTELGAGFGVTMADPPAAAGLACLDRARPVAGRFRKRRLEQRQELMALVALVREAVAAAGLQLDTIHSEIEASSDHFDAITNEPDPKRIKAQVLAHVSLLKQLVAEKREAWEAQRRNLSDRIAVLEQQLTASRREASTDGLTGAANQGSFQAEYEARVSRAGSQLVLAMLDVDSFKSINDTRGHVEGDRLLRAIVQGLKKGLRDNDFVARVGGDEFAVLLEKVTLRQAEVRFTSLLARIRADAAGPDGTSAPSLSCGLAELSAGDTPASLYERADQALYAAKRAGKNRVVCKTRPLMRDLMRR